MRFESKRGRNPAGLATGRSDGRSALVQKRSGMGGQYVRRRIENPVLEFGQFNQRRAVDHLSESDKVQLNLAWHRLDAWPDAVAGLERLKSRYIIGTLSNGNIALIVNMAKHSGLPWDVVLGAEVARAYKPQPQAYLGSAQALGLTPGECMLVAAHNDDLKAAAQCGFRTAFVERPFEHGPDQKIDRTADGDYDYVARDFVDLALQLRC